MSFAVDWSGDRKRVWNLEDQGRPDLSADSLPKGAVVTGDALFGHEVGPVEPLDVPHRLQESDLVQSGAVRLVPPLVQKQPIGVLTTAAVTATGFLEKNEKFDGVLCVPGLETAWIQVSAQEIVSFQVFETGALSFGADLGLAFQAALEDAMSSPALVPQRRAGLKAALRLKAAGEDEIAAQMLGLTLGVELAGARPYWLGQRVCVLTDHDTDPHFSALEYVSAFPEKSSADDAIREGFRALAGMT